MVHLVMFVKLFCCRTSCLSGEGTVVFMVLLCFV